MPKKLYYYNPDTFHKLAEFKGMDMNHPYWHFSKLALSPIFDRTETLDTPFHYKVISKIPKMPEQTPIERPVPIAHPNHEGDTIFGLMDRRAKKIIKKNKPIILYWSGGIDSTAALAALLVNGVDTKSLTVRLNDFSIIEHEQFYKNHIKDTLNVDKVGPNPKMALTNDDLKESVIVTGELGDQLMGSTLYKAFHPSTLSPCPACEKYYINNEMWDSGCYLLFEEPWEDFVRAYFYGFSFESHMIEHERAEKMLEYCRPLADKCPFPVKNAFDFFWWLNITCKWQGVGFRFVDHLDLTKKEFSNINHFFDDISLQRWSMTVENHEYNKLRRISVSKENKYQAYRTMKWVLKKYIMKRFDHDKDYFNNKIKIGSLPLSQGSNWWFRTSDFQRTSHDRSSSPKAFDLKYGNEFDSIWKA